MELKGEYRIPAPREAVWAMLNDPDVLRVCIPGCETLDGSPGEGFSARVTTKIGPVKATFNGAVTLSNVNAPESYRISGEGKGGVAGFAKGGADVHLAQDGSDTVLTYVANAQVGGKLAQLGSRLIDSTAKKLADQFFACFAERAGAGTASAAGAAVAATDAEAAGLQAAAALGMPEASGAPSQPSASQPPQPVAPVSEPATATASAAPDPVILPGQPIPPAATGVPIVDGQAATPETVPPIPASTPHVDPTPLHHGTAAAAPAPATAASVAHGASIQAAAHEVEEEIERKAAMGFLGGPITWALLVLLALIVIYVIAT